MLEEADNLRKKGELNNANKLKNWVRIFLKADGDFLAVIALEAEADRLLKQRSQQFEISQYGKALQSWEQALTIYRKIGDRPGEANSLHNFGNAYLFLGQYKRALKFYKQSLEIFREIEARQG